MLAQARRFRWTFPVLLISLAAALALSGCASDGEKKDDESWRTASQRVGDRRPLPGDEKKKAAAKAAADKIAEQRKEEGEGAETSSGLLPEEAIRLDPDGPEDRSAFVRWKDDLPVPVKVHDPQPQYNEEARKARIQGIVVFDLYIDENGDVQGADLVKDLPMGLTLEAYKAVKTWRFEPVVVDEVGVPVIYRVTVNFRLQ